MILKMWSMLCFGLFSLISVQASDIEYLGDHLQVYWTVVQNPSDFGIPYTGTLTLTNTGPEDVMGSDWEIYFCSVRLMFPLQLRGNGPDFGHLIGDTNIQIYHLNGCLHKFKPNNYFAGFKQNEKVLIPYEASDWSVSRTDIMPRWYVTDALRNVVKTIASTSNEELNFVADFDSSDKWKRVIGIDKYDPYTAEVRFNRNTAEDMGGPKKRVIPTPVTEHYDDTMHVDLNSGDWKVVYSSDDVKNETEFLAAMLNTEAVAESDTPSNRYILINMGQVDGVDINNTEAYELHVMPDISVINITGSSSAGAFFGIQTLLSLHSYSSIIPKADVVDYPRFPYRGMHLDVGRNFQNKETILNLLDVMAMYKLNNFHFHLTDDEGWRLEIDDLPELTSIGAQRCFDLDEDECIISQLGSGPTTHTSGSGFYTKEEYKEILRYANERHIQVTPEFDMPGHMHAGIKAMEARSHKTNDSQYLLTDFNDSSNYLSVQWFRDNAVNPCMNSTYNFVTKVIEEIQVLHKDIQPLMAFNFGGDEVAHDAWVNSSACNELIENNPELKPDEYTTKNTILHKYFVTKVAEIANAAGLNLAGWEDGLKFNNSAIPRSDIPNGKAYVFAWNNVWEWGNSGRAHEYANEDYKVVISHATHFYYDHPQEPDPEERGFYWATRVTDIAKSFGYYADDVYENVHETLFGDPLTKEEFCNENHCEELEEGKRQNVIGIQGHLWSETVRTSEQLDAMIFPRMLAMAERAWHKASWEDLTACGENCESLKATDWSEFANSLGYKELKRLTDHGVKYYVPPPGARITEEDGNYKLEVNVDLPGQPLVYSVDDGETWQTIQMGTPVTMDENKEIHINVRSVDIGRSGRTVTVQTGTISGECRPSIAMSVLIASVVVLALLK